MSEKRRGLGRGLGALIPPASTEGTASPGRPSGKGGRPVDVMFGGPDPRATVTAPLTEEAVAPAASAADAAPTAGSRPGSSDGLVEVPGATFAEITLAELRANPRQPRQEFDDEALSELTASIQEVGLLQPIVVRPLTPPIDGVRYEIVMGERRWRAVQAAGLATIPAIVRDTADEDLLRDALLENLHRAQLNPLEEAAAYQQLLDDVGCTHEELSRRIARSRPQVTNTLRLLKLPAPVQRRLAAGVLSAGHGRALLGLSDAATAEKLAARIVAEGLSVRTTEEIVALGADPTEKPAHRTEPRPGTRLEAIDALQDRLADRFDTRVKVLLGKRKGRLTIEFASVRDLNRILDILAPGDPGLLR